MEYRVLVSGVWYVFEWSIGYWFLEPGMFSNGVLGIGFWSLVCFRMEYWVLDSGVRLNQNVSLLYYSG